MMPAPLVSKHPVLLGLARQRLDDEFDLASVATVRDMITSMNLLACLIPQRQPAVDRDRGA